MDVKVNDLELKDISVTMHSSRKLDRILVQNTDGEDLVDHGRASFEFELNGEVSIEKYKQLLEIVKGGNLTFTSGHGEFNVVTKYMAYKDDGRLYLRFVEDIRTDDE